MTQLFSNAYSTNQDGFLIHTYIIKTLSPKLWDCKQPHSTGKHPFVTFEFEIGFHYKLYSSKDLCCCTRTKHIWENDDWLKTAWRTKERGKTSKNEIKNILFESGRNGGWFVFGLQVFPWEQPEASWAWRLCWWTFTGRADASPQCTTVAGTGNGHFDLWRTTRRCCFAFGAGIIVS